MPDISAANLAALSASSLVPRDFIRFIVADPVSAAPRQFAFWSGVGNVSAQVVNPDTQAALTLDFVGAGALFAIDEIERVSELSAQTISVVLNGIDPTAEAMVRGHVIKQARVDIWRGLLSVSTRLQIAPAMCRFSGLIDDSEILTPAETGSDTAAITLDVVDHKHEFSRSSTETRSPESQRLRLANDAFFDDVDVVGDWPQFWGSEKGKMETRRQ